MPQWTGPADLGVDNLPNFGGAGTQAYRVTNAVNTYVPGIVLQLAPVDSQVYPDFQTVQPSPAAASGTKIVGVVTDGWTGFDNAGVVSNGGVGAQSASFISPALQTNLAGTQYVRAKVKGFNYVLVNTADGITIVDGTPLVTSQLTAGYAQGATVANAASAGCVVAYANLPAASTIPGYEFVHASLAQATTDFTVASPAAGDTVNTIIQTPFTDLQPGTVQTTTWSVTINTAGAVSATTAALQILTYLNAQPSFNKYFIATQTAGAVHIAVNALSVPFLVTGGTTSGSGNAQEQWRVYMSLSGMSANLLTTVGSVTGSGGTTYSAAGTTFGGGTAAGTGYFGICAAILAPNAAY